MFANVYGSVRVCECVSGSLDLYKFVRAYFSTTPGKTDVVAPAKNILIPQHTYIHTYIGTNIFYVKCHGVVPTSIACAAETCQQGREREKMYAAEIFIKREFSRRK